MFTIEVSQLEQYLLSEDKPKFINSLVKDTFESDWFRLIHSMNTKQEFSQEEENIIQKLGKQHGFSSKDIGKFNHCLEFKMLLKQLETSNPEQQIKILEKLQNDYLTVRNNYSRPSYQHGSLQNNQNSNLKSDLDQSIFSIDNYLNTLVTKKDYNTLLNLPLNTHTKFDILKISNDFTQQQLLIYLKNVQYQSLQEDVIDILTSLWEKCTDKNQLEFQFSQIFQSLTIQQLQNFGNKFEEAKAWNSYSSNLFIKIFGKQQQNFQNLKLIDLNNQQKLERRTLLNEMREWSVQNLNQQHYQLSDQLFYEILVIDMQLEQFNEKLFIQFLERPLNYYNTQLPLIQERLTILGNQKLSPSQQFYQTHKLNVDQWPSEFELASSYLKYFFQTDQDYSKYQVYLDNDYLQNLFYSVKLQTGIVYPNINDYLSSTQISYLMNSREITICDVNEHFFGPKDEVKMVIDIKNIQDLTVKVFEINTENYYLKNQGPFDNSLNLEGINPIDRQANVKLSDNPLLIKRHEFKFEKLSSIQRGVFIIEFIGNNITSRAVIRKGGLAFLSKKTIAGQLLTLVSEDSEVCQPNPDKNHTGIWIKGRFHKANKDGEIIVPYGDSAENVQLILVHNNFADIGSLQIDKETYEFKAAYLYNQESFLRGSKAKIIIQPRLYIHNIPSNLKILEDQLITAVLINEQNIPNTYQFKQKYDTKEDIEIEIPVQNLVRSVTITITGRIKLMGGSYQDIQDKHLINFDLYEKKQQFVNIYLKECGESYVLYCLGKNGEPKSEVVVDVSILNTWIPTPFTAKLKTNSAGQIILGKLVDVQKISIVTAQTQQIKQIFKFWNIENRTQINYPSLIQIIEGEAVSIPAINSELNKNMYTFYEKLDSQILQDCLPNLTYDNHQIIINNLKQGQYILKIKKFNHDIQIQVIKGNYWQKNPSYIVSQETRFYETSPHTQSNLKILKTEFKNSEKGEEFVDAKINLSLPDNLNTDYLRVHVIAYNFLDQEVNIQVDKLRKIKNPEDLSNVQFGSKKSIYLNNKQLGDEICYVIERKKQQKYIGNTLQKPSILLKRTFNRDTNFEQENLQQDIEYKQGLQERFQVTAASSSVQRLVQANLAVMDVPMDSMLNFLQNPAFIKSNIKLSGGAIIVKDIPRWYSTLQIIVCNLHANIQSTVCLDMVSEMKFRDSRLVSNLQKKVNYCEKRGSIYLRNGETTAIKSDSESIIIDNLVQLFEIQKELKVTLKGNDTENGSGYRFWDFLKSWGGMDQKEKLQKYDEFACHEINIFLYFKDRSFFDNVIFYFLQNKIEKTFVDYFLISDLIQIRKFTSLASQQKLNSMEKCLLIIALCKDDQQELAERISQNMLMSLKDQPQNTFTKKLLFDTVISAKAKSGAQEQMQKIKIQKNEECVRQNLMMCSEQMIFPSMKKLGGMRQAQAFCAPMMKRAAMPVKEEQKSSNIDQINDDFADKLIEQRQNFKQGYQKLKKTKEFVERTYYNLKDSNQSSSLIDLNLFWSDLAVYISQHKGQLTGFLSENFIYSNNCHAEMICALSFMDLLYQTGEFELKAIEGRKISIKSGKNSNLLIFLKDIIQCNQNINKNIAINQRFFDPNDRYTFLEDDPNVQIEKDISEYLLDTVYGCQTIVTNCSVAKLQLQVLTEIPEGALPVYQNEYTKSHTLDINSYNTQKLESFFYFPSVGKYTMYPANASMNELILSSANDVGVITVQQSKEEKTLESFRDILQNGSQQDILNFVSSKNILNSNIFKFSDLYWLLEQDKNFYLEFVKVLRARSVWDYGTWELSLLHHDPETFFEFFNSNQFQKKYLNSNKKLSMQCLKSAKLNFDTLQLFEYHPLVSSRSHNFMNEKKSKIQNVEFKNTYQKFLEYLVEVENISNENYLVWSYYLLLQERVNEAIQVYQNIKNFDCIQHDYLKAYLDIYTGGPNYAEARKISQKYLDYPVLSWRNLFQNVDNQLKEYDGDQIDEVQQVKDMDLGKNLQNAEMTSSFTYELSNSNLIFYYQNIDKLTINLYEIDLEVLFSRSPFANKNRDEFSFVKANHTETLQLQKHTSVQNQQYTLPENLAKKNLYIQMKSHNQIQATNYFSTSLKVQLIENYGQVKVMDVNNAPLSKVYVKVFAKDQQNNESFYRDGYTDLRGRYDYALSSSSDLNTVQKFSILICSDTLGSKILEAKKPSDLGSMQETLVLKTQKK